MAVNIPDQLGYAKRDSSNLVDWGTIASGITKEIRDVRKRRIGERQEIENQTNELNKAIQDVELGQSQSGNDFIMAGAGQASNSLLTINRLFKNGEITQNDYARFRQKLGDDWTQLKNSFTQFNQLYANAKSELDQDKLSALGEKSFDAFKSFTDMKNNVINVDPTTGALVIRNTKTGEIMPVQNMGNQAIDLAKQYDLDSNVSELVETLGIVDFVTKDGGKTIKSITNNPKFKDALTQYQESILGDARNASSVLTGYDTKYKVFLGDKDQTNKDADGKVIAYDSSNPFHILASRDSNNSWQPDLTDTQRQAVKTIVEDNLMAKIDREVKINTQNKLLQDNKVQRFSKIDLITDIFSLKGSAAGQVAQETLDSFNKNLPSNKRITNITRRDGKLFITGEGFRDFQTTGNTEQDYLSVAERLGLSTIPDFKQLINEYRAEGNTLAQVAAPRTLDEIKEEIRTKQPNLNEEEVKRLAEIEFQQSQDDINFSIDAFKESIDPQTAQVNNPDGKQQSLASWILSIPDYDASIAEYKSPGDPDATFLQDRGKIQQIGKDYLFAFNSIVPTAEGFNFELVEDDAFENQFESRGRQRQKLKATTTDPQYILKVTTPDKKVFEINVLGDNVTIQDEVLKFINDNRNVTEDIMVDPNDMG
ncbi:MAG: hypothetical protein GOVbin2056_83 [Prokaryotic dsDNA virus sp.]|nr:MAG: hypothetical protein GOVbin2056_83 [Prokaryotic dsDNA virus sp.]